ncbi:MAG: hypothetical protein JWO56_1522 [Acidobacteria bacterium]|nr:hypothetical protein [Acidobacteriota bacterium]
MVGTYLADAQVRQEGNRIIFMFDDSFKADSASDAKGTMEEIARELFGPATRVEIGVQQAAPAATKRRAEDQPSALRDDPVVQAFAKHLGGEVVESRKR